MPSTSTNIGHFVSKRALLNPDLEALVDVDTGRRFTFAELNDRVNRTAHVLSDNGVGRGDRVALLMMNSVEFEESLLRHRQARRDGGAAQLAPRRRRAGVHPRRRRGRRTSSSAAEFADVVADLRDRGDETSLATFIQVGDDVRPWALDYAAVQAAASNEEIDVETDADDLLYIMYTSGTTGLPKGVMHSH